MELLRRYISEPQRNLLRASDPQPLPLLQNLHEAARLDERGMSAGIKPSEAAAEHLNKKFAAIKISAVDVGDFDLSAVRRLDRGGNVDDVVIVEVEASDRDVRLRLGRLFLD